MGTKKEINIAVLSDLHGELDGVSVSDKSDVLLIAGDTVPYPIQEYPDDSALWFSTVFQEWCDAQPVDHIFFIAGNHDFLFDRTDIGSPMHPILDKGYTMPFGKKTTYIYCDTVDYEGFKIYGSPWTPWFWNWAFNLPQDSPEVNQNHWSRIPDDTDILLTHGPPANILDVSRGIPCGDVDLLDRIGQLDKLKLHVFGHIHPGFGRRDIDGVIYFNAAYGDYKRYKRPKVAEIVTLYK